MKIVGRREDRPIEFHASGDLLAAGARWNEGMGQLPAGRAASIPRGIYRFKTHEDATAHWLDCVAARMAEIADSRA